MQCTHIVRPVVIVDIVDTQKPHRSRLSSVQAQTEACNFKSSGNIRKQHAATAHYYDIMWIYVRIVRSFGKSPMGLIFGPAEVSKYFHFWFCGPFLVFLTRCDTLTQLWPSWETPEVPTRLMELAPHELNCCLAGVVSLGCSDHKFFVSVGKSAQARHSFRNSNRIKRMKKHKPEILYNLGKTSKVFWQDSGRFGVRSRFIDDL